MQALYSLSTFKIRKISSYRLSFPFQWKKLGTLSIGSSFDLRILTFFALSFSKQWNELSNFTSRQWGMSNDCPSIYRQACFQTWLKPITCKEVLCVISLACVSVSVLKSIGVWISLRSFQQSWPSKHWRPRVSVKVSRRLLASRQMLTLWHNELNTLSKNTTLRHHSWTIQTECEKTVLGKTRFGASLSFYTEPMHLIAQCLPTFQNEAHW